MEEHLGYEKSERSDSDDYRNGYKRKRVNSRYGSMEIEVPQDRKSSFFSLAIIIGLLMIIYFIIEDPLRHYLQKKFHTPLKISF